MKKLISILQIYALIAYLCMPALASTGTIQKADVYEGGKNVLQNSSFDFPTYNYGWTLTTATGAKEVSTVVDGKQSAKLTFSASTGDISESLTPSVNTASQNWEASCKVNTSLGTIQVCALSGGTEIQCQNVPATSTWQQVTSNFIGPANGTSVGVRVKTTASATGTVYVDDCYVGPARNLSQVSQAQVLGTVTITGCAANWSSTSASFADFPVQTGCVYTTTGQAQAPSTMIPAIKFASLPPGELLLQYEGNAVSVGSNVGAYYQFSDGTNTARETSYIASSTGNLFTNGITQSISYTTAQSNVTLSIKTKVDSGATSRLYGTTSQPGVIKVYFFPSQSQTALRPDATPASWSGYHDTDCTWTTSSTTAGGVDPTADASCTFNERKNRNFGTVTSAGSKTPGITFTPPRAGRYYVCAIANASNSVSTWYTYLYLTDGTTQISTGSARYPNYLNTPLCGIYDAASTASTTIKIQMQSENAAGSANLGGNGVVKAIEWSIFELDGLGGVYLQNQVSTNSSGMERVERAMFSGGALTTVCSSTPCTINSQSGSWISSITRTGLGQYTLNVNAGIFSAAPSCSTAADITFGNSSVCAMNISGSSSTAVKLVCSNNNFSATADAIASVICMGPR